MAKDAPVLMLTMVSAKFANGRLNASARHDLGLAVGNLSLQATHLGIGLHQMGGFYPAKAKEIFGIPEDVDVVTAIALGYLGDPESLEEPFRSRELAERTRKPITDFVYTEVYKK